MKTRLTPSNGAGSNVPFASATHCSLIPVSSESICDQERLQTSGPRISPSKMTEEKEDSSSASFTLKNASSGFAGRSNDVFAGLDVLEKQHIVHEQGRTDLDEYSNLNQPDDDLDVDSVSRRGKAYSQQQSEGRMSSHRERNRDVTRRDDTGSEGRPPSRRDNQFRRPRGRAPGRNPGRRNWMPDHGNHPQKWTFYSLEDVKGSDMSEKSNTKTALAFLSERRKQREQEEQEERFDAGSAACSKGLFSFAKRSKVSSTSKDKTETEEKEKASAETSISSEAADEPLNTDSTLDDAEDSETVTEPSAVSSAEETKASEVKPSFKNRKGIKRSIRSRDDD